MQVWRELTLPRSLPQLGSSGTQTVCEDGLFQSLPLIVPSDDADTPRASVILHRDRSVGPSAAADENKSNWKSTASATAKLLLLAVRDSADAFPPLKSVAGALCSILENTEVRSISYTPLVPPYLQLS